MSIKGSIIKVEGLDKVTGFYSSVHEVARALKSAAPRKSPRQPKLHRDAPAMVEQAGHAA